MLLCFNQNALKPHIAKGSFSIFKDFVACLDIFSADFDIQFIFYPPTIFNIKTKGDIYEKGNDT